MNAHRLNTLLQYIANKEIAPWNPITDVDTDCDDIGTISKDDQAALDAFYQRFPTADNALADDVLADDVAAVVLANKAPTVLANEAPTVLATVDAATVDANNAASAVIANDEATADEADTILSKADVVAYDEAAAVVAYDEAAAAKPPRKKKLQEVFHTEVQVDERHQGEGESEDEGAFSIKAQYTAHNLQPNGEYDIKHKSVTFYFKKDTNQEKRTKIAKYKAKNSTIENYGMRYKPGCPCNFTRVVRFILEHPNHLFKNGAPIPESLTILYYDN
jgi:hypothetical protein